MKLTNRTLAPRPKPWQRRRQRPYPREIAVLDRAPLAQIDIYEDCLILTRRERGSWRSYPISADALAQALGKLPIAAGLLPEGTIGAGLRDGDPFYIQHVPARQTRIQVDEGGQAATYRLCLPPLIWAGWRSEYRIFALGPSKVVSPLTAETPLYHAPLPNVYPTGAICWGNVRVARANPTTLPQLRQTFLEESLFNQHLDGDKSRAASGSILVQLRKLAKQPEVPYPLDDLRATSYKLGALLDGSLWSRR
jgi:hypothetical protein